MKYSVLVSLPFLFSTTYCYPYKGDENDYEIYTRDSINSDGPVYLRNYVDTEDHQLVSLHPRQEQILRPRHGSHGLSGDEVVVPFDPKIVREKAIRLDNLRDAMDRFTKDGLRCTYCGNIKSRAVLSDRQLCFVAVSIQADPKLYNSVASKTFTKYRKNSNSWSNYAKPTKKRPKQWGFEDQREGLGARLGNLLHRYEEAWQSLLAMTEKLEKSGLCSVVKANDKSIAYSFRPEVKEVKAPTNSIEEDDADYANFVYQPDPFSTSWQSTLLGFNDADLAPKTSWISNVWRGAVNRLGLRPGNMQDSELIHHESSSPDSYAKPLKPLAEPQPGTSGDFPPPNQDSSKPSKSSNEFSQPDVPGLTIPPKAYIPPRKPADGLPSGPGN